MIQALEDYIAWGGKVLLSDDCTVKVAGALRIGCPLSESRTLRYRQLRNDERWEDVWDCGTMGGFMSDMLPFARALERQLRRLGFAPVFTSDTPTIVASHQGEGDIDYYFAVNATPAYDLAPRAANLGSLTHADGILLATARATIDLPGSDRPVYDALLGGEAREFRKNGEQMTATLRFGPGQMRVFACSARPIGGVRLAAPLLERDYTREHDPVRLTLAATLLDMHGDRLDGTAPLHIEVFDSLGRTRYDLYRATKLGLYADKLQLAVNEAPGIWHVVITELLTNTSGRADFTLTVPASCPALAGQARGAIWFGNDWDNMFRFLHTYQQVTLVTGTVPYEHTMAERLANELKVWQIHAAIVAATEVNKPRALSAEEAVTWCGADYARSGEIKAGTVNPINLVGFDLRGPVILLGTPQDNPLLDYLNKRNFLPYTPDADFPGRGNGLLAWQIDGIGTGQESIALIAYDAPGMSEAVNALNRIVAGIKPLLPYELPTRAAISGAPALPAAPPPGLRLTGQIALPDRAAVMKRVPGGKVLVLSVDGTLACLTSTGAIEWRQSIAGQENWLLHVSPAGTVIAVGAARHSFALTVAGKDSGSVPLPRRLRCARSAWWRSRRTAAHRRADDGGNLALFSADGTRQWTHAGVPSDALAQWQAQLHAWYAAKTENDRAVSAWEKTLAAWRTGPDYLKKPAPAYPAMAPRPDQPLPLWPTHALFSADGASLLVLATEQVQQIGDGTYPVPKGANACLYRASDGQLLCRIDRISAEVAPVRAGEDIALVDGTQQVVRLDPGTGATRTTLPLPPAWRGTMRRRKRCNSSPTAPSRPSHRKARACTSAWRATATSDSSQPAATPRSGRQPPLPPDQTAGARCRAGGSLLGWLAHRAGYGNRPPAGDATTPSRHRRPAGATPRCSSGWRMGAFWCCAPTGYMGSERFIGQKANAA